MSDKDTIYRQDAIDAVDSEIVSTNPEYFKSSEKFIKFMDDADIASFGKWNWANGFNTAVIAARIQLKKLPSAQPETIRCKDCKFGEQDEIGRWFCRSIGCQIANKDSSGLCADAERRTDVSYNSKCKGLSGENTGRKEKDSGGVPV